MLFRGCATALVTPFRECGKIDYTSLAQMIERQLACGVKTLVVCGTTGEASTLSAVEKKVLIGFTVKAVGGRGTVIAGIGSNCTRTAIENAIRAQKLGADALLAVTPYYNKCTQSGLVAHYGAICAAVDLPVMCYNVPSRTGVNICLSTYRELLNIRNLVAVKEASEDLTQIA